MNILLLVNIFDIKNIFYVNFRLCEFHGLRHHEHLGFVNLMYKLEILNILDIVNILDTIHEHRGHCEYNKHHEHLGHREHFIPHDILDLMAVSDFVNFMDFMYKILETMDFVDRLCDCSILNNVADPRIRIFPSQILDPDSQQRI
jgi:hypothetical protein